MAETQDGERLDPFAGFNFRIEVEGIEVAGFKEISGLEMTTEVIEYSEGNGMNSKTRKIPGRTSFSNLVCKKGLVEDNSFWEWCESANDHPRNIERRTVTVQLMSDYIAEEATGASKTFTLFECWPVRYSVSGLDAGGNELAMEEIEFCYEDMTVGEGAEPGEKAAEEEE